jgi:hypothetical protein
MTVSEKEKQRFMTDLRFDEELSFADAVEIG